MAFLGCDKLSFLLIFLHCLYVEGGISIMDDFLKEFYTTVYANKIGKKSGNYCKYDNQAFQLFSSSLCLSALLASFLASTVTRKLGHRATMVGAGIFYMLGAIVGAGGVDLFMVILARVLMGAGVGFSNQVIFVIGLCNVKAFNSGNICLLHKLLAELPI